MIAQVVDVFKANPNAEMVLGNVDFVDCESLDRPVRFYSSFNFAPWKMRLGFIPAHPAAFIKRSAYEKVGNYKLGYKIGSDFEWFVRALVVHRLTSMKLNKTLVRMRQGGVSTSGLKSNWIATQDMYRALAVNGKNSYGLVVIRLPIKLFYKLFYKS